MQLIPRNPRKSPLIQYGGFFYAVALPQEVQIKMNKDDISQALKRPLLYGTRFNELIAKPTGQSKQLDQGNTFYTVQVIKTWSQTFYKQVAKLAKVLQKDSLETTCINIHSFLYNHLQYQADGALQNLRSPANSWHNRKEGIDCKSYSIFASCILTNLGINHYIRQIKQAGFNPENFSHVYIVVPKDQTTANLENGYFTIDGTLKNTSEPNFIIKEDEFMSKLEHMGLNGAKKKAPAKKKVVKKIATKKVTTKKTGLMFFN